MDDPIRLLKELVAIPSINPMGRDLRGPEIYEHQITAYLENQFRELGVRHERQHVAPLRDNVIAYYEPVDATSTLILEVHQDTVPIDNVTIEPFGGYVENGRLYGRGACDVKGGMAAMLTAFARLVREKPARSPRVILACCVDEEFTFLGVQRFVKDDLRGSVKGPIVAVVAEPTCLNVVHAHKGAVRWKLSTHGRSCHSSRPEQGINAIYHVAKLLGWIEKFADELRATRSHPLLGSATLSVGRIEGGTSVNTIPDHCQIEIDRRTLPGEVAEAVAEELMSYLQKHVPKEIIFSQGKPWLSCPALSPEGSESLVEQLGKAIDSVTGGHLVEVVPYGTDASTLAEAGIPSVVFGPGDIAQAHTRDEWIDVEQVRKASEIFYRLATSG